MLMFCTGPNDSIEFQAFIQRCVNLWAGEKPRRCDETWYTCCGTMTYFDIRIFFLQEHSDAASVEIAAATCSVEES